MVVCCFISFIDTFYKLTVLVHMLHVYIQKYCCVLFGVLHNHLFVSVTLRGMDGRQFQGFLVQLRSQSSQAIVGNQLTATGSDIQRHMCDPPTGGFTHTSMSNKDNITFLWTPALRSGDLVFRLIEA